MNTNSEKMSILEREKLRKRLRTLFQKQERKSSGISDYSGNKKFQSEQHTVHNFQATKREMKMNEKKMSKPQQSPTVITNKKKQGPQLKDSHNDKTPAANNSSKFNLKNKIKKSPQTLPVSKNSKLQEKQLTKGKKSTQTELSQQNGLTKTSTVKSKNNSNVNKNAEISKKLKKEEKTTSQKSTPQARKHQKLESPKKQNKAETCTSNKSVTNGANPPITKTNRKNKRNKKRKAASETSMEQAINTNKKPKLNNEISKNNNKNNQQKNYDSSSEQENVYDMKNMKGLVRGGDYDEDSEEYNDSEDEYWLHQYNNEQDIDDSDYSNNAFKQQELIEHKLPYSDGEDEKDYNCDSDEDHRAYWDFDDEEEEGEDEEEEDEEEEEEHYSDYDEDDYEVDEEEENSYDYSMDSDSSSDYFGNDSSYDFNYDDHDDDDDDYNLPEHVPEDLIIHRGTATKRDIKPDDNVNFDSDHEEAQIVELQEQETVKVIQQPKAYHKEELRKLKYCEKTIKTLTFLKQSTEKTSPPSKVTDHHANDTNECPILVPIVDEDGFQLYNPNEEEEEEEEEGEDEHETADSDAYEDYGEMDDDVSLGSEYMEIDSDNADSLLSMDINDKYLNRGDNYSDSADEIDENIWFRKHKVDIIDATKCEYLDNKQKNTSEESEDILNDDIKQLPSEKLYKNVDLKTASSIISITIIDKPEGKEKQTLQTPKTRQENLSGTKFSESLVEETVESENTNDSASEKSSGIETQQIEHVKSSNYQSLVNYNTKFFNALDSNLVMVLLKDPFYIYGTVRLTLLLGNVEIYGHTLSVNKEVEIFSPRGCNVIEITPQTKSKTSSEVDVKATLKNYEKHFALADLKTICDNYDCEHDAVVLLKRNEMHKKVVQQFKKFMNENVFPNLNNIKVDRPLYNSEYLLRCMINTSNQELKCLRIPQQWQQLSISSKSRVMVAGGKGVGKSTLLRYLMNRSLPCQQQILLIDLDIGQPEVFVPQTVSCTVVRQPLLGPGFMLNLEPDISYAVGHTNIALCAHKYLEAVRQLIAYCMKEDKYQEIPWLINTMGYNKGFGLELISVIVKEFTNLSDIIQLQSAKEINNFDAVLYPHVLKSVPRNMFVTEEYSGSDNLAETKEYRLHVWQSAVQKQSRYQKEWEMSAKDLRFAILLTRLSQALQGHAEWLTDCKPLCAPLEKLKIVNLMNNTPLATTEELAKSLEANLVYLCHYQEDNNPLKCLGIGVVRAIDFHVRQVYLLPAIPYALLKSVNCLALGEMCLPTSIFTNQGPRIKNTAPFVYNTIKANASKAIKQIYHRPRRFLTGKHKSLD